MLDPKSIIELEEMADKENGWVVPLQEKNRKKNLKSLKKSLEWIKKKGTQNRVLF